ncbi:hypothetical protein VaNZ11_001250 [Volvox africanus]|uniref:Protein kinase domain-containing protein n=1 Tax=Volvox africanus TaxID=51714 RepID=A0ABQ5RPL1_9CHLO|nr:hypothetical protein VaNZ11_001250 [Volvox africanus]
MGLCHSVEEQEPSSGYTRKDADERPLQNPPPPVLNVEPVQAADPEPCSPLYTATDVDVQQKDDQNYFQEVSFKSHAFIGESGCLSFAGCLPAGDRAPRPVIITLATRNFLSEDMINKLQRLAGRKVHDGLLHRLAFSNERIIRPMQGFQQGFPMSKHFSSAINGVVRSYGGIEGNGRPVRPVQWSSCPTINRQNSIDQKDVPVSISGPCFPSPFSSKPTSRLASQNTDIAAALSYMPLPDGQDLVACIDEAPPEMQGNLLQAILGFQSRSNMDGLTELFVTYALQVAEAIAALHRLGVHHGCLTPIAVTLVPRERDRMHAIPAAPTVNPANRPTDIDLVSAGTASAKPTDPPALRCKVALYGLVNPVEYAGRLAYNAAGWGAVSYLAPECFTSNAATVTQNMLARMDVHAFGALCYHLFTGVAPYNQYHAAQVLVGLSAGGLQLSWPPADGRRPPVPEPVRQLVGRCLDRSPESRPAFPEIVSILEVLQKDSTC